MARDWGPQGIHVAHVIIDGGINGDLLNTRRPQLKEQRGEDGLLDVDAIADTYWHLYTQDKTAWAQEIDLRPYKEDVLSVGRSGPKEGECMDFGLLLPFRNPKQWEVPFPQLYQEHIEQAILAEELGYDHIWTDRAPFCGRRLVTLPAANPVRHGHENQPHSARDLYYHPAPA